MIYRIQLGAPVLRKMAMDITHLTRVWTKLPCPDLCKHQNRRLRFWFTEEGFKKFGMSFLDIAEALGHKPKVIKAKEPRRSRIVYRDRWQLALLPERS